MVIKVSVKERPRIGSVEYRGNKNLNASKIAEAGASLVGGHTVDNPELVYGLAVTGRVDPRRLLTNAGARPGDLLVLTEPLGLGVTATAVTVVGPE